MRKKAFILFFILIVIIPLPTGCWNYREINNLSIVAGFAIDKTEDGRYLLTAEIVRMAEGEKQGKMESKKLESYGDTIFDAVRNILKIEGERLYYGHAEIVIISQEVAKEGIIDIIDFLNRDSEPRLTVDLLISKENTAKEILEAPSVTTEIASFNINQRLEVQKVVSKVPKIQTYEFTNAMAEDGISAVLPTIHLTYNNGKMITELSGTAIFRQDKLIGFLNEEETKTYLFIMNKIKGGIIVLNESSQHEHADISLEINENNTKEKPKYVNGKLYIDLDIRSGMTLGEYEDKATYSIPDISKIKENAEKKINADTKNLIKKVQEEYNVDIFGFGRSIKENMPSLWKIIGPEWDQKFKKLSVNVNTTVEIKQSGLMLRPIKIGD